MELLVRTLRVILGKTVSVSLEWAGALEDLAGYIWWNFDIELEFRVIKKLFLVLSL